MYTNRESISLGVVAGIEACASGKGKPVYQMLEDLKNHPSVAPVMTPRWWSIPDTWCRRAASTSCHR